MSEAHKSPSEGSAQAGVANETGAAPAAADGIDRIEFRRGLNDLHRQVADIDETVKDEALELRRFLSWLVHTYALMVFLLWVAVSVKLKSTERR